MNQLFSSLPLALAAGLLFGGMLPARGEGKVTIKALCFPRSEEKSSIELLIGKEKVIKIPLQAHEFTLPQKIPRLVKWQFGKSNTDSRGKFTFKTQATVAPLSSDRQLLLFMQRGRDNKNGYTVTPLNPELIQGRNYLFLNITRGPIAGMVGGMRFRLKSGRRVVIMPDANRGHNLCFASLHYKRNENWRSFFSSNWRLRKNSRTLIFIYQTSDQPVPKIHSVIDPL